MTSQRVELDAEIDRQPPNKHTLQCDQINTEVNVMLHNYCSDICEIDKLQGTLSNVKRLE